MRSVLFVVMLGLAVTVNAYGCHCNTILCDMNCWPKIEPCGKCCGRCVLVAPIGKRQGAGAGGENLTQFERYTTDLVESSESAWLEDLTTNTPKEQVSTSVAIRLLLPLFLSHYLPPALVLAQIFFGFIPAVVAQDDVSLLQSPGFMQLIDRGGGKYAIRECYTDACGESVAEITTENALIRRDSESQALHKYKCVGQAAICLGVVVWVAAATAFAAPVVAAANIAGCVAAQIWCELVQ